MSRTAEDTALLQPPVQLAKPGFGSVVKIWNDSTIEVKNMLDNECEIVFQCSHCQNMFRSLVNFISHKRGMCRTLHGVQNEANESDLANEDAGVTTRSRRKTKGLLKRTNIVGVLNKRIEHAEIKVRNVGTFDLQTLPRISKSIPETTFKDGVQIFKRMPESIAMKEEAPSNRTALVIPLDQSVQYLDMNLRRRENTQKENCAREVTLEEVEIMDRLEKFASQLVDLGSLKCLDKSCSSNQPFASVHILAYHVSVKHNSPQSADNKLLCLVCGSSCPSYDNLCCHLEESHEECLKLHNASRASLIEEKETKKIKKTRSVSQNLAGLQRAGAERSHSLSPVRETAVIEDPDMLKEPSTSTSLDTQERADFCASTSDQNLEKSDDDDMSHQSSLVDEVDQAPIDDAQVVVNCVRNLVDQICAEEEEEKVEERKAESTSAEPKPSGGTSKRRVGRPKKIARKCTDVAPLKPKIEEPEEEAEQPLLLTLKSSSDAPHDSADKTAGDQKEGTSSVSSDCTGEESEPLEKPEAEETVEAQSQQVAKKRTASGRKGWNAAESPSNEEYEQKTPAAEKRRRKTRSDKGKPRRPKNEETSPTVEEEEKKPVEKEVIKKRRRSRAKKSVVADDEQCEQGCSREGSSKRPGKVDSRSLYFYRQKFLKRKNMGKELASQAGVSDEKDSAEDNKKASGPLSKPLPVRSGIKKKCVRPNYAEEDKDGTEAESNQNEQGTSEPAESTEPLRRRYRRFSHQCIPISSIDCTFRPRWRVPIVRMHHSAHVGILDSTSTEISFGENKKRSASSKKAIPFLRRSHGSQRKDDPTNAATSFMDPSSIPVYLTEAQNKLIFSSIVPDLSSDTNPFKCMYCGEAFKNKMESRKHAVGHLRIMRLRCKLCGCGSFFCSDMRSHLQMRHCEMLASAPSGVVRPGSAIPCMTYNQADSLIEIADKERPGHVVFTSGKIISFGIYKPYFPDAAIESKILGSSSVKDMADRISS